MIYVSCSFYIRMIYQNDISERYIRLTECSDEPSAITGLIFLTVMSLLPCSQVVQAVRSFLL